jgi:pimeloyl-ACP methyl ester carboxylesterase
MTAPTVPGYLDVPGGRLYYEVRGSGPLLLVIGQPMSSEPFAPLADLLAADHTVVTYDPHGLARSTVDDPALEVTPEVQADDLALLVDAVGAGPADVFASSGGAVAALALAARHPEQVRTVIAHEPPVTELLPDAPHIRAAVDGIEDAYRQHGSGGGWGAFVSLVVHDGPLTGPEVPPAAWPPPGQDVGEEDASQGGGADGAGQEPPAPSAKQQADDELFFLRMLKPFTRYRPLVDVLRSGSPQIVIGIGEASGGELAGRSTRALAEQLGVEPTPFPGDHAGFLGDTRAFADTLSRVL